MDPVVMPRSGRGWAVRAQRFAVRLLLLAAGASFAPLAQGHAQSSGVIGLRPQSASAIHKAAAQKAAAKLAKPAPSAKPSSALADHPPAIQHSLQPAEPPPRYRIHDANGREMVARFHGKDDAKTVVELPDSRLGIPSMLIPTDDVFQHMSAADIEDELQTGDYAGFQLLKTDHYLIFYQSTPDFARDSGRLLEDLYRGLYDAFKKSGFPVHAPETPLVAVAYRNEADYRKNNRVDPEVQASYEIYSNRIFFYQHSDREQKAPELTAILTPQTVAHEGAHQILANIGVQPRLSPWPLWLIEGLAEYCCTTSRTKKGIVWNGIGAINPAHMVTLRELRDPISIRMGTRPEEKDPTPLRYGDRAATLIRKSRINATDYAHSWAMTHYLASKRPTEFVDFLKVMSALPPLSKQTPEQQLALFREHFGHDLVKLDKRIDEAVVKLSQRKGYDRLPYYAVILEQSLGDGRIRRQAMVSQSPQIIRQWVANNTLALGTPPSWQYLKLDTRARATLVAEQWLSGQ